MKTFKRFQRKHFNKQFIKRFTTLKLKLIEKTVEIYDWSKEEDMYLELNCDLLHGLIQI
ncbi:hypothetical protein pb186bvf_007191 [Paramecium bursaria]